MNSYEYNEKRPMGGSSSAKNRTKERKKKANVLTHIKFSFLGYFGCNPANLQNFISFVDEFCILQKVPLSCSKKILQFVIIT